jgi:hypothetical protein
MPKLFIPQGWADSAHMEDRIAIEGLTMTVKLDGKRYRLEEAVRVLSVEGGDPDDLGLVGKVKTQGQLESLGGEQVGESLICGETAYRVCQGFLADFQGEGDPISVVFRT